MYLKQTVLILLLALTVFLFEGCAPKIKYIYVKTKCPKLETFEVNTSKNKHYTIHYTIKDINESSRN